MHNAFNNNRETITTIKNAGTHTHTHTLMYKRKGENCVAYVSSLFFTFLKIHDTHTHALAYAMTTYVCIIALCFAFSSCLLLSSPNK